MADDGKFLACGLRDSLVMGLFLVGTGIGPRTMLGGGWRRALCAERLRQISGQGSRSRPNAIEGAGCAGSTEDPPGNILCSCCSCLNLAAKMPPSCSPGAGKCSTSGPRQHAIGPHSRKMAPQAPHRPCGDSPTVQFASAATLWNPPSHLCRTNHGAWIWPCPTGSFTPTFRSQLSQRTIRKPPSAHY